MRKLAEILFPPPRIVIAAVSVFAVSKKGEKKETERGRGRGRGDGKIKRGRRKEWRETEGVEREGRRWRERGK